MSLKRQDARRDANEKPIVEALKAVGARVYQISEKGIPDLLVGYRGDTFLMEIKQPKGVLTDDQDDFFRNWPGGFVHVVRSVPQALQIIGAIEVGSLLDE